MSLKVHRHCVKTAGAVSPPLKSALIRIGRVTLPARKRLGLPQFLARVIVGQQLSTAAARSIWARLQIAVRSNGGSVPAFFCERNARLLRRCGISGAKVRALIAMREAHEGGMLSVRRLGRMNHAARSVHLQQIWGVGQWSADMTSIFYFGDADVWPEGDAGVYHGVETIVGKRSKRTVLKMANAFAPYRSYLALYLWRSLEAPKPAARKPASKQPV